MGGDNGVDLADYAWDDRSSEQGTRADSHYHFALAWATTPLPAAGGLPSRAPEAGALPWSARLSNGALWAAGGRPFCVGVTGESIEIEVSGNARWLEVHRAKVTSARVNGKRLAIERVGREAVRVSVPNGESRLVLR